VDRVSNHLARGARRHERLLIRAVAALAAVLCALLVAHSPKPFGYVWDFYPAGVEILYSTGRLPRAEDCWACFHPPLYYVLGWPFYAFGHALRPQDDVLALRWLGGLALTCAAATALYAYRLLRFFGCRGGSLVLGSALVAACPCLFISAYAPEADIVLTAFLSAFLYYLVKYAAAPASASRLDVCRIGVLAGAAASTKYSGLLAPLTIAMTMALVFARRPARRIVVHAAAMLAIAAVLGSWQYVNNVRRYGTLLHANGSASEGFSVASSRMPDESGHRYEFTSLRLRDVGRLFASPPPAGEQNAFPVYSSVFTTLHALAWSDMSFFSVRGRHGDPSNQYPRKLIPVPLIMSVLVLGLVPELLALIGFVRALRHPSMWPLIVFSCAGLAAYVWWFLPQTAWALKTKYILFLLPPGVVFAMTGLGWLRRKSAAVCAAVTIALVMLIVLADVYLYAFAVGRP